MMAPQSGRTTLWQDCKGRSHFCSCSSRELKADSYSLSSPHIEFYFLKLAILFIFLLYYECSCASQARLMLACWNVDCSRFLITNMYFPLTLLTTHTMMFNSFREDGCTLDSGQCFHEQYVHTSTFFLNNFVSYPNNYPFTIPCTLFYTSKLFYF